jgi:prolyl-tRNA synthetase
MRQSHLFTKTTKEAPKDEVSINAQLLSRAGFIDKLMAGVYSYLPLGLRVLKHVQQIVREEMDAVGAQEILMPALTPKERWIRTGRWDEIDVLFKLEGAGNKEYALGSTHEEIVTPLVQRFVSSYKDLPVAVYQIQNKFRNEARAKSGLLRGREFNMKDLYSFHEDEADLEAYYEKVTGAYKNIFVRCGLDAHVVEASGGVFSKYSHEFQVPTEYGEDLVYFCGSCGCHQNKELVEKEGDPCPYCGGEREAKKTIEVGNIFKLKTKFSAPFDFSYTDKEGKKQDVVMGCYGIGPSRVMGAIAEIHHDDRGLIWPESVAPFAVHLVSLCKDDADIREADRLYEELEQKGISVLYDDRVDHHAGEKFADSDLLGIPLRIVVSPKTLKENSIEVKERSKQESALIKRDEVGGYLTTE